MEGTRAGQESPAQGHPRSHRECTAVRPQTQRAPSAGGTPGWHRWLGHTPSCLPRTRKHRPRLPRTAPPPTRQGCSAARGRGPTFPRPAPRWGPGAERQRGGGTGRGCPRAARQAKHAATVCSREHPARPAPSWKGDAAPAPARPPGEQAPTGAALKECTGLSSRWEAPCRRARPERAGPRLHGRGRPPAPRGRAHRCFSSSERARAASRVCACWRGRRGLSGCFPERPRPLRVGGGVGDQLPPQPGPPQHFLRLSPSPCPYAGSRGPLGGPATPTWGAPRCVRNKDSKSTPPPSAKPTLTPTCGAPRHPAATGSPRGVFSEEA